MGLCVEGPSPGRIETRSPIHRLFISFDDPEKVTPLYAIIPHMGNQESCEP